MKLITIQKKRKNDQKENKMITSIICVLYLFIIEKDKSPGSEKRESMIKAERLEEIVEILKVKKHVTIDYLSKHIFVSPVTIRRDIKELEKNGLVKRSYGGISLLEHENKTVPLYLREKENFAEKKQIARQAALLIKEGNTIFMDASTTTLLMANYLEKNMNVTVFTNNIRAVNILVEKEIRVYCSGGLLLNQSLACVGPHAEAMFSGVNVDMLFFSSQGLMEDGRISDFSETETNLRKLMIKQAQRKIFLCDSSKLNKRCLFTLCNVKEIDQVICDKDLKDFFS